MAQLIPFIVLGIAIAAAAGLFIVFIYLLIWGIIVGSIIWLASLLKQYFFPKVPLQEDKPGRIIEHDDRL